MSKEFSTGLCESCCVCPSFCLSACFPCVQYGINAAELQYPGQNKMESVFINTLFYAAAMFGGCYGCLGGMTRTQIRKKYDIEGSECKDCCISCFCECCALVQEKRQLELPAPGYFNQQPATVVMVPPGQQQYQQQPYYPPPQQQSGYPQQGQPAPSYYPPQGNSQQKY